MKRHLKNGLALLCVFAIFLSAFLSTVAQEQILVYSTQSNSGTRYTVCTTLAGTSAAEYYTGEYTYDNLSELSSSQLLYSLRELMTDTHKKQTSYDNCRDYADQTDCEENNGKIITLYTSVETSLSNYNSGNTWNREHVWPKSIGGFETSGGGSDLHHIRPAESNVNSTRSNRKYGEVIDGKTVSGKIDGSIGGTYGSSSAGSDYFEPNDNVKGDVARICLYVYVRWGGTYSQSSNITNVFQSVDILLDWCELDPVDTWEMGRNEVVGAIQGNRNVFIDYPELAWELFGREVPDDMTTPSGEAKGTAGSSTDSSTSTTTPPSTHTWNAGVITAAPSCTQTGIKVYTCSDCGETYTEILEATGHTFNNKVCVDCGFVTTATPSFTETITFDDAKTQRTSFSTSQQIWKSANVTFTNSKSSSSNNVADYSNPVRLYKSSTVTIEAPENISKIEIVSDSSSTYKTALVNSLTAAGLTYTTSGNSYILEDLGTNAVTFSLAAQSRFMSVTVTYGEGECTHKNLTLDSETAPTCTANGEKVYTCDDCGETYTEALPATGHSYTSSVTTAPTHLTTGVKTYTCSSCGNSYTETLAKLPDHEWDNGKVTAEPTHLSTGEKLFTCICGETYTETLTKLPDHEWDNGKVTAAPTHLSTGIKTFTCPCGETYTETLAKLPDHTHDTYSPLNDDQHQILCACGDAILEDHDWKLDEIINSIASYSCPDCKASKSVTLTYVAGDVNADGKIDLNDAVQVKIYLANYDYNTNTSTVTVAPGADACADGKIDLNDAVLLALYLANFDYGTGTSTVELGKHDCNAYCNDASCTEPMICSICGATVAEATGHTDTNADGACDTCGTALSPAIPEGQVSIADALAASDGTEVIVTGTVSEINTAWSDQYGNITVTITDGVNELYVYRLATLVQLGDTITVTGTMTTYNSTKEVAAGATAEIVAAHDCDEYSNEATCTTPKTCQSCGATVGEALGHTAPNAQGKCDTCGEDLITKTASSTVSVFGSTGTKDGTASISWANDVFTVTNEKSSSSTAIRTTDTNHYRCYKNSVFTLSTNNGEAITKIVIKAYGESKYQTPIQASAEAAGYTVTVDGEYYTVINTDASSTITFTASAQFRFCEVTVYYESVS